MDSFIEDQRPVTVQANQETDTIESSLNKEFDEFQRKIDQKLDIMQESISKLTNQLVHQDEENLEEGCLIDTILGEQAQLQLQEELKEEPAEAPPEELLDAPQLGVVYGSWKKEEEILPLLSEESNGKEAVEEPQNPSTQATNSPLSSLDPVYTLPTAQFTLEAPSPKAKSSPSLPAMQNFKRLVATVHNFATTPKTLAVAYVSWHSGWFGYGFGFEAPEPRHSCKLRQFQQPQKA